MEKGQYTFSLPSEKDSDDYRRIVGEIRESLFAMQEESAYDMGEHRSPFERENRFLSLISTGNPALLDDYLAKHFHTDAPVDIGVLSYDSLQQAKYIFVSGVTLATRTAMSSGLPEKAARSISDAYIRHVDQMTDPGKIGAMYIHAVKTFCMFVQHHRLSNLTPDLRTCCEYISEHLHSRLTLEEISQATHLSAYQVSALFREQLNTTPIQYCLDMKIRYARDLLEVTDLTVSQVAETLAFPSHSNFSARFRKVCGVTPQAYRKLCREREKSVWPSDMRKTIGEDRQNAQKTGE